MKKVLLFSLAICAALLVVAQQRVKGPSHLVNTPKTAVFRTPLDGNQVIENASNPTVKSFMFITEDEIGETKYDLQTNSALSNRLHRFSDGTFSAVWTRGMNETAFADRGTGHNYFDGFSWGPWPSVRVESVRTGWPSIAPLGANGEIIVSHQSGTTPLVINKRATKGTGPWTQSFYAPPTGANGYLWPRMAVGGPDKNTIHLIALTSPTGNGGTVYQGQDGALLYSRSTDGGNTWDIQHLIPTGMGSSFYTFVSADDYCIAEPVGNTVAFLVGSEWYDLYLMKSTDNGSTWTKTVIWQHPFPMWDWNTSLFNDTLWAVDGSFNVALDQDGMAHVVWGLTRVRHSEPGTSYNYWPYSDGIGYWNESMGTLPAHPTNMFKTLSPDWLEANGNLIGWSQDYNGNGTWDLFDFEVLAYRTLGISNMPTIHIDEFNRIFVIYASVTETFDDGTYYYKKLWGRSSPDNGTTWGEFIHLTEDIIHMFDESIYPVLAQTSDDHIYYIYNVDESPGLALDADHPYQQNRMIFAKLPKPEIVGTGTQPKPNNFEVKQNYPNPASGVTKVLVELPVAGNVNVSAFNLMGQKVIDLGTETKTAGKHIYTLDVSNLNTGIYFYTVKYGNQSVTKKFVVR